MTTTDTEIIARQARELIELRDEVARLKESASMARMQIIGIGGPLNDNKLGFNKEQLGVFRRIERELAP